jgi:hypothetical protein
VGIRADQNTYIGIYVAGNGNIVRNNQVVATGGSTLSGGLVEAYGIWADGPGARLLNNDVTEVTAVGPSLAIGIYLSYSSNGVVAGNRVGNITSPSGSSYGIYLNVGTGLLASDNRLSGTYHGIYIIGGATGKYMNNMTQDVTTPYTGGTAAGATNY